MIHSTSGASNAERITNEVANVASASDLIILGLDKYTWSYYRNCDRDLKELSRERNFKYMTLGSKSFEGMILSYTKILKVVKLYPQGLEPLVLDVINRLNNKRSLHRRLGHYESELKRIINQDANVRNEENFVSWLLSCVTKKPNARSIKKDSIGNCWLIDCCSAHANTKAACPSKGSWRGDYLNKIFHIESNSLMTSNSMRLSELRRWSNT